MAKIQIDSEDQLVEALRTSKAYNDFRDRKLQHKINREKKAWELLQQHKGEYTKQILDKIFNTLDLDDTNQPWFGHLLNKPNRNLIFESSLDHINRWVGELLFSNRDPEEALNICLTTMKIKAASQGLTTLLLYLSNPENYNVWVPKTELGLFVLNRIKEFAGSTWGDKYSEFNKAAIEFRIKFGFLPQEVDWILTFLAKNVENVDDHFVIDEKWLKKEEVPISVVDESEIDEIVGEPMELRVMRWTPTNEMGVVALFAAFLKELGFSYIEIIRTGFPDAVVYETDPKKGNIRRSIEFEFKSSGFRAHVKKDHPKYRKKCHYVVCWEHDWKECPIPVIELKQRIPSILSKIA